jgi:hypothetical protein
LFIEKSHHAEQVVMDRLNREGIFQNAPNVITIGLMGYSWGGGTAVDIADHLEYAPENADWKDIPVHMAIIDAVEIGSMHLAYPAGFDENASYRPGNVDSLFNRYQTNAAPSQEEILDDLLAHDVIDLHPGIDPALLSRALYGVFTSGNPAHGRVYAEWEGDDQESLGLETDHFLIDDANTPDRDINGKEVDDGEGGFVMIIDVALQHIRNHMK